MLQDFGRLQKGDRVQVVEVRNVGENGYVQETTTVVVSKSCEGGASEVRVSESKSRESKARN